MLGEPDFNDDNKMAGRQMMRHAEKHDQIAYEQYGSRKDKAAVTQAVNKKLTLDNFRLKKWQTP